MGTIISVLVMILVSVAAAIAWTSAQRRRLPGRRKVLDLATIYNRFYRDSDLELSDVEVAYNRIAEATGVPAGALRPGDRFSDDLAPPKGWEYDDALPVLRRPRRGCRFSWNWSRYRKGGDGR